MSLVETVWMGSVWERARPTKEVPDWSLLPGLVAVVVVAVEVTVVPPVAAQDEDEDEDEDDDHHDDVLSPLPWKAFGKLDYPRRRGTRPQKRRGVGEIPNKR